MLKICANSICKVLEIIYSDSLSLGLFPLEWKKGKNVPIHKKGDKQCLKNYRPESTGIGTSRCLWKVLQELIFNKMFQFLTNQSGFKPGDICINQWLTITYDIYKKFEGWGVWGQRSFPWYMKEFDKVWHQGIVFKLKENDISGNMLIFSKRETRGSVWMEKFPTGQMLPKEFPKDPF